MALFILGIDCPICHKPIDAHEDVVMFPPFVADACDSLHLFSDATLHSACFAQHPLAEDARRWCEKARQADRQPYHCTVCNQPIQHPDDYFGFGLLTRDPSHPLYLYNFTHIHQQHVDSWILLPRLLETVRSLELTGSWRGPRLVYTSDSHTKLRWQP